MEQWLILLSEYEFDIQHMPGKSNDSADYLSRSKGEGTDGEDAPSLARNFEGMVRSRGEHVLVTGLDDVEVTMGDVGRDLRGVKEYLQMFDGQAVSRKARRRAGNAAVEDGTLFRRTKQVLRFVPPWA